MAEPVKIIRIDLHVDGGGSGTGSGSSKPRKAKEAETYGDRVHKRFDSRMKSKLAGAGGVIAISQLISEGFSIAETLSYNSAEKTNLMALGMAKSAVSGSLVAGGYILGGPVGAAVGMAVNQFVVEPLNNYGKISIQRHLDQTRATNRFYQTNFSSNGNMVFDYSKNLYINESLDKIQKGTCYKRRSVR